MSSTDSFFVGACMRQMDLDACRADGRICRATEYTDPKKGRSEWSANNSEDDGVEVLFYLGN